MGADSFEFGTTALMMLKCVMAKNCNIKCPAGLTTNPEVFEGDARALAQYFLNTAHDVRRILARLGFSSLRAIRGKTSLLHLINHSSVIGSLDFRDFLQEIEEISVENLKAFVVEYFAGNLEKFLKSEPLPEDWDASPVKTLVSSNFVKVAKDKSEDVFVKFYAPWCGE